MTELGKKVWDKMEEMGWENAPEEFHLEYYENIIECTKQELTILEVGCSLPIKELPNCNRVEVIDQKGRSYVNWQPNNKVRLSMQDDGRTAKIFID